MANIFKNSTGVRIIITVSGIADVSTASNIMFYYKKPSGATGFWVGSVESATSFSYATSTDDLSEVGTYELQPYFELGEWKGRGTIVTFTVQDIL